MENEVIKLIKFELDNTDIANAINNICAKKELVAIMVGYILKDETIKLLDE